MRRQERINLIYYLRVFDGESREIIGHLANVTPDGIMLIGEHPLTSGERHKLAMDLPRHLGAAEQLEFTGEVIWSKPQEGTPFYNSGVRLVAVSSDQRKLLDQMMQEFDSVGIGLNLSDEMNPPELPT